MARQQAAAAEEAARRQEDVILERERIQAVTAENRERLMQEILRQ